MKASPLICYKFVTPGQEYDKRDGPRTGPWSIRRGRGPQTPFGLRGRGPQTSFGLRGRGPQTSFGLRGCLRCCRVWPPVRHRLIDPPGGRTAAVALCNLSRRARPCTRGRTAPLYPERIQSLDVVRRELDPPRAWRTWDATNRFRPLSCAGAVAAAWQVKAGWCLHSS
jgi:hypothetical protein